MTCCSEEKKTAVTKQDVTDYIVDIEFSKMGAKTTVGLAKLKNGYEILESAYCVHPENYSEDMGRQLVRERVENKVWSLLGFKLQCDLAGCCCSEEGL